MGFAGLREAVFQRLEPVTAEESEHVPRPCRFHAAFAGLARRQRGAGRLVSRGVILACGNGGK